MGSPLSTAAESSANDGNVSPSAITFNLRYAASPVPAGIRLPIMTFSLKPVRSSRLPSVAASVRTLVVSWNEAALMKLSVSRLAFVIPSRIGSPVGYLSVGFHKFVFIDLLPPEII